MAIDATFWVAVSFIIFFGGLIYLKVPHKIKVFKVKGKVKVPKGYDDKGNFIIKKGSNAR